MPGSFILRRNLLRGLSSLPLLAGPLGCARRPQERASKATSPSPATDSQLEATAAGAAGEAATESQGLSEPAWREFALGQPPWPTFDPFLFCVHHKDDFPAGDGAMAPSASLAGRRIGSDFSSKDGWSMYHGERVPGFPRHPHRGFETVTVTRRGYVDHSDSLGARARYGEGDVQWMTAGRGIVHAEMFPLLDDSAPNHAELFQIWLNLPRRSKFVEPYFSMFWKNRVPTVERVDARGARVTLTLSAGALDGARPPKPPPDSWASSPQAEVAIWTLRFEPYAEVQLPLASAGVTRTLYFFSGGEVSVAGAGAQLRRLLPGHGLHGQADTALKLQAGGAGAEVLLLQGRPIGEPVVKHGPFVMNERREIQEAYRDFQLTQFGGWPWSSADPVHAPTAGRFAQHADGRKESAG